MRPLEILLPILLIASVLWPLFRLQRPDLLGLLPTFALLVVITHARVEGMRWTMYPLYAITGILFLISLPAYLKPGQTAASNPPAGGRSAAGRWLTAGLILVLTALPLLLPVNPIRRPGGSYSIGTRTYELTDSAREEIYASIPGLPRRILVQVWYPAPAPEINVKPEPWIASNDPLIDALESYFKFPPFFLSHLSQIRTNSYDSLPLLPGGPYPVIVFSHGLNGFRQQSTAQVEELASRGYVVIVPEFPYASMITSFSNGDIAYHNPAVFPPSSVSPDVYETGARLLINQWVEDIAFALDFFSQQNADPQSPFYQALDLEKIGLFGHSTGGGATIEFCARDPRCKAGFTEDAFVRPLNIKTLENGTTQPFFYLFSEVWPFPRNTELFNEYYAHSRPGSPVTTLSGAAHYDFTQLPTLSPLAGPLGLKGQMDGARNEAILRAYVSAFFDQTLKNLPSPLVSSPVDEYPEVRWPPLAP